MKEETYNKEELAIDVGVRVRAARVHAHMTQIQLAETMGDTTQSALARLETGKALPTLHMLLRIAKALGTGVIAPYFANAPRTYSHSFTSSAGNETVSFNLPNQ